MELHRTKLLEKKLVIISLDLCIGPGTTGGGQQSVLMIELIINVTDF